MQFKTKRIFQVVQVKFLQRVTNVDGEGFRGDVVDWSCATEIQVILYDF